MWKGSVGVHDAGGTPRKKASVRHPMALGSGAAPSAMYTPARRTPSPAVQRRLRPARQAAEEGAAILGEDRPAGRASEPGAVGGAGSLPEPRQPSGCCVQARRDPRGQTARRTVLALAPAPPPPDTAPARAMATRPGEPPAVTTPPAHQATPREPRAPARRATASRTPRRGGARPAGCGSSHTPAACDSAHRPLAATAATIPLAATAATATRAEPRHSHAERWSDTAMDR
jgi:hypothetical protein